MAWTSDPEEAWLTERIPERLKVKQTPGQQIETWLRSTATEFLKRFPARAESIGYDQLIPVCT